jgi:hypothetical protein
MGQVSSSSHYSSIFTLIVRPAVPPVEVVVLDAFLLVGQVSLSTVHAISSDTVGAVETASSNVDSMTSTAQSVVLMVSGTVPLLSLTVPDVMSASSSEVHSAVSSAHGSALLLLDMMGVRSSLGRGLLSGS